MRAVIEFLALAVAWIFGAFVIGALGVWLSGKGRDEPPL